LLVAAMLIGIPAWAQIDFSGEWAVRNHEDCLTNNCQPPLGNYLGVPLNAAGRARAETTAESIWGIPEYQCRPHSPAHQWRGVGGSRFQKEIDPITRDLTAYHVQWWRSMDRVIYLDGRKHPPASEVSLHGHSVGRWEGETLVVETTNFKEHPMGLSTSLPSSTGKRLTERFGLSPDRKNLIYSGTIEDPVYLAKPVEWTGRWEYRPGMQHSNEKCNLDVARKFLTDF
jgi:hypothetical protein